MKVVPMSAKEIMKVVPMSAKEIVEVTPVSEKEIIKVSQFQSKKLCKSIHGDFVCNEALNFGLKEFGTSLYNRR